MLRIVCCEKVCESYAANLVVAPLHLVPALFCTGTLNSDLLLPYVQVEALVSVADALGRLLQNDHQVCFGWKACQHVPAARGMSSVFM